MYDYIDIDEAIDIENYVRERSESYGRGTRPGLMCFSTGLIQWKAPEVYTNEVEECSGSS